MSEYYVDTITIKIDREPRLPEMKSGERIWIPPHGNRQNGIWGTVVGITASQRAQPGQVDD